MNDICTYVCVYMYICTCVYYYDAYKSDQPVSLVKRDGGCGSSQEPCLKRRSQSTVLLQFVHCSSLPAEKTGKTGFKTSFKLMMKLVSSIKTELCTQMSALKPTIASSPGSPSWHTMFLCVTFEPI